MIEKIIYNGRLRMNVLMLFSCLFSLILVIYRVHSTGSITYVFLIWNLILALIPFGITSLITSNSSIEKSKIGFWLLFICWFVFIPNAPYIITDLFHLRFTHSFPIWFDLLLILSFAWNGLILCYLSIAEMQEVIQRKFSPIYGWIMSLSLLLLSGFGIYLGRYLRWNSWDLLNNTEQVFFDISERVTSPTMHLRTWGVTLGFGVFLIIGYLVFKELSRSAHDHKH